MRRIVLMQQWYDLSDPAIEDALLEMPMLRRYEGIVLISERIPDEMAILAFHHLLEKHALGTIVETIKTLQVQRHGRGAKHVHRCHLDRSPQLDQEQQG